MKTSISRKSPERFSAADVKTAPGREVEGQEPKTKPSNPNPETQIIEGQERSAKRPEWMRPKETPLGLEPWKPGQSGSPATQFGQPNAPARNRGSKPTNPSKMPITIAMRELLNAPYTGKCKRWQHRKYTNAEALAARQIEMAIEHGDMRAAEELANRAEGKVVSVQQLQGPDGGPIEISAMSPEEKQARLVELLSKAAELSL